MEELTDDEINSIVNEIDQPTNQVMPDAAPPETTTENGTETGLVFNANGKEVVAKDIDQLKQYASQGYNYAQLMQDQKIKQSEFESKVNAFNEKFGQYEKIDAHAASNPDWWEHVNDSFQKKSEAQFNQNTEGEEGAVDISQNPEFQAMKSQLDGFKSFMDDYNQSKKLEQTRQEDEALNGEIQSIRESFPDLDWETVGPEGKSLEFQVLEHAQGIGTSSFRAAFRDFYHDKLLERAESKGKEVVGKEIQRNNKLGLLGETLAPLKKLQEESNPKNLSYDQLEAEALNELGIAQ